MSDAPPTLQFETLDQAVEHARSLLANGYEPTGQWSLGQNCWHMATFTDFSLDGFPMLKVPWPISAGLRRLFINDKTMSKPMPAGMPTAPKLTPVDAVDDAKAVEAYAESCRRFDERLDAGGPFAKRALFGRLSPDLWHRVHLGHAAHHLGFLQPKVAA